MYQHLFIFDLVDAMALLGICCREKLTRNISLLLMQESSKLKRLVGGFGSRKSLGDLRYYNDLAIRERVVDRLLVLKLFKSRKKIEGRPTESFSKIYQREEVEAILDQISFFRSLEDSFEYSSVKINESLARDIQVLYLGELTTLWKNEFKSFVSEKQMRLKDHHASKINR